MHIIPYLRRGGKKPPWVSCEAVYIVLEYDYKAQLIYKPISLFISKNYTNFLIRNLNYPVLYGTSVNVILCAELADKFTGT